MGGAFEGELVELLRDVISSFFSACRGARASEINGALIKTKMALA